jgi:hypothetical protein
LFKAIRIWGNDTEKDTVDSIIQYVDMIDGWKFVTGFFSRF